MLWILLHWLIGMRLRQRILIMALALMLMIKIELRLGGRKKRLPHHLMKWQKRESRWQFPTRWLMMHVDNWEQNSVMMIVGEKSFGNDWSCKNISHRLLLLGQWVHSALTPTISDLARPITITIHNLPLFFVLLETHLLLMENSLESLDPPASESAPMEELPSPARVRLPSSSQEGRIGEV